MKKTKVIYALIVSAMLSLAVTGCGSNETIENDMSVESTTPAPTDAVDSGGVVDSDDVTPTTEPTATSAPEPTATSTPVPTETPTPEPTTTSTPVPTEISTPEPTATSTPVPTVTPTPESASQEEGVKLTVIVKHVEHFSQKEIAEEDVYTFNTANVTSKNLEKKLENYTCIGMESTDQYKYIQGYYDVIWDVSVKNGNRVDNEVYNVKFDVLSLPEEDLEIVRILEYLDSSLFANEEAITTTPIPEPTEAPTVEPTPEPTDAFSDVEVLGLGTYFDITYPRYENGQLVEELITVGFDEVILKDGRIRYTFQTNWSEHKDFCVTVVDKSTGIEFVDAGTTISPLVCSDPSITLADGTVVEFTITAFSSWDDWELNHTDKMIFVPAEYDDFLFVWKVYDEAGNAVPYKYFGLE